MDSFGKHLGKDSFLINFSGDRVGKINYSVKVRRDVYIVKDGQTVPLVQVLGTDRIPLEGFVTEGGERIDTTVVKLIRDQLNQRPGIYNATSNSLVWNRATENYLLMAQRVIQEKTKLNLSAAYKQAMEQLFPEYDVDVKAFKAINQWDPFQTLDPRLGTSVPWDSVDDATKYTAYGNLEYHGGSLRVVQNPILGAPKIQDVDRDTLYGFQIRLVNKTTGKTELVKVQGHKWPYHTLQLGMVSGLEYDPNEKFRRVAAPDISAMFRDTAKLASANNIAKDKAKLAERFAAHLEADEIGILTSKLWTGAAYRGASLIENLPDLLAPYIPRNIAMDIANELKKDATKRSVFLYRAEESLRSGRQKYAQENFIKAKNSGRVVEGDLSDLQGRVALDVMDEMLTFPKHINAMNNEQKIDYLRKLAFATPEERLDMFLGLSSPNFQEASPYNPNAPRQPKSPVEIKFDGGKVVTPKRTRAPILEALMTPSVRDPLTGALKPILEAQKVTFSQDQIPGLNPAEHYGYLVTTRGLDGNIKPIVGAAPSEGRHRAIYLLPKRDANGKFIDPLDHLSLELERDLQGTGISDYGVGELVGKYSPDALSSPRGINQARELARVAGQDVEYIWELTRRISRGDTQALVTLKALKTRKDLSSFGNETKLRQTLQGTVGSLGLEVDVNTNQGFLNFSRAHQIEDLSRKLGVDLGLGNLDKASKLKIMEKVNENIALVPGGRVMSNDRMYLELVADQTRESISPIGSSEFIDSRRTYKLAKYSQNSLPLDPFNVAIFDFNFSPEELAKLEGAWGDTSKFQPESLSEGQLWLTNYGLEKEKTAIGKGDPRLVSTSEGEFLHGFSFRDDGLEETRYSSSPLEANRLIHDKFGTYRVEPLHLRSNVKVVMEDGKELPIDAFMSIGEIGAKGGNLETLRKLAEQAGGQARAAFLEWERSGYEEAQAKKLWSHIPHRKVTFKVGEETIEKNLPILLGQQLFSANTDGDAQLATWTDDFSSGGGENLRKLFGDLVESTASTAETLGYSLDRGTIAETLKRNFPIASSDVLDFATTLTTPRAEKEMFRLGQMAALNGDDAIRVLKELFPHLL